MVRARNRTIACLVGESLTVVPLDKPLVNDLLACMAVFDHCLEHCPLKADHLAVECPGAFIEDVASENFDSMELALWYTVPVAWRRYRQPGTSNVVLMAYLNTTGISWEAVGEGFYDWGSHMGPEVSIDDLRLIASGKIPFPRLRHGKRR
jgi:hypothetical protein